MVKMLMISSKMATQGILKIKVFSYSSCIVDVVIWLKFGKSSMSIREVIRTSIF